MSKTKKKIERLELLLKLSRKNTEDAKRMVLDAKNRQLQAEEGLRRLSDYRDEYSDSFAERGKKGVSVSEINNFHNFITHLGEVESKQLSALKQGEEQIEAVIKYWQQMSMKEKSFDKLLGKRKSELSSEEEKKQQKELDELINNMKINKKY